MSEPVTGSSVVPAPDGKKARTSIASGDPAGWRPNRPIFRFVAPGLTASTASALASSTATQPGPLSAHWASMNSDRATPSTAATSCSVGSSTGPLRSVDGARKAEALRGAPERDQAGRAFLHDHVAPGGRAAGLQPGVRGAEGGVPGERQLLLGVKIRTR